MSQTMLRPRENAVSYKAGALSIAVHALLLIGMMVSLNWKTKHETRIAEVELWDSIPPKTQPRPPPVFEKVIEKEAVKEPLPQTSAPIPESKEDAKVDIALKKRPAEKVAELKKSDPKKIEPEKVEPIKVEPKKNNDALEELQKQLRQDALQHSDTLKDSKQKIDALKKIQQETGK